MPLPTLDPDHNQYFGTSPQVQSLNAKALRAGLNRTLECIEVDRRDLERTLLARPEDLDVIRFEGLVQETLDLLSGIEVYLHEGDRNEQLLPPGRRAQEAAAFRREHLRLREELPALLGAVKDRVAADARRRREALAAARAMGETELARLLDEAYQLRAALRDARNRVRRTKNAASEEVERLQARLEATERGVIEERARVTLLQNHTATREQMLKALEGRLATATRELREAKEDVERLKQAVTAARAEAEAARGELQKTQAQMEKNTQRTAAAEQRVAELTDELKKAEDRAAEAEGRATTFNREVETMRQAALEAERTVLGSIRKLLRAEDAALAAAADGLKVAGAAGGLLLLGRWALRGKARRGRRVAGASPNDSSSLNPFDEDVDGALGAAGVKSALPGDPADRSQHRKAPGNEQFSHNPFDQHADGALGAAGAKNPYPKDRPQPPPSKLSSGKQSVPAAGEKSTSPGDSSDRSPRGEALGHAKSTSSKPPPTRGSPPKGKPPPSKKSVPAKPPPNSFGHEQILHGKLPPNFKPCNALLEKTDGDFTPSESERKLVVNALATFLYHMSFAMKERASDDQTAAMMWLRMQGVRTVMEKLLNHIAVGKQSMFTTLADHWVGDGNVTQALTTAINDITARFGTLELKRDASIVCNESVVREWKENVNVTTEAIEYLRHMMKQLFPHGTGDILKNGAYNPEVFWQVQRIHNAIELIEEGAKKFDQREQPGNPIMTRLTQLSRDGGISCSIVTTSSSDKSVTTPLGPRTSLPILTDFLTAVMELATSKAPRPTTTSKAKPATTSATKSLQLLTEDEAKVMRFIESAVTSIDSDKKSDIQTLVKEYVNPPRGEPSRPLPWNLPCLLQGAFPADDPESLPEKCKPVVLRFSRSVIHELANSVQSSCGDEFRGNVSAIARSCDAWLRTVRKINVIFTLNPRNPRQGTQERPPSAYKNYEENFDGQVFRAWVTSAWINNTQMWLDLQHALSNWKEGSLCSHLQEYKKAQGYESLQELITVLGNLQAALREAMGSDGAPFTSSAYWATFRFVEFVCELTYLWKDCRIIAPDTALDTEPVPNHARGQAANEVNLRKVDRTASVTKPASNHARGPAANEVNLRKVDILRCEALSPHGVVVINDGATGGELLSVCTADMLSRNWKHVTNDRNILSSAMDTLSKAQKITNTAKITDANSESTDALDVILEFFKTSLSARTCLAHTGNAFLLAHRFDNVSDEWFDDRDDNSFFWSDYNNGTGTNYWGWILMTVRALLFQRDKPLDHKDDGWQQQVDVAAACARAWRPSRSTTRHEQHNMFSEDETPTDTSNDERTKSLKERTLTLKDPERPMTLSKTGRRVGPQSLRMKSENQTRQLKQLQEALTQQSERSEHLRAELEEAQNALTQQSEQSAAERKYATTRLEEIIAEAEEATKKKRELLEAKHAETQSLRTELEDETRKSKQSLEGLAQTSEDLKTELKDALNALTQQSEQSAAERRHVTTGLEGRIAEAVEAAKKNRELLEAKHAETQNLRTELNEETRKSKQSLEGLTQTSEQREHLSRELQEALNALAQQSEQSVADRKNATRLEEQLAEAEEAAVKNRELLEAEHAARMEAQSKAHQDAMQAARQVYDEQNTHARQALLLTSHLRSARARPP
jgi:hypothetical protein